MSANQYHINSNDEAKECTATVRACRFGPLDGPNHFNDLAEAQAEAERRTEANEGGTFKNTVKKAKKEKVAKIDPTVNAPLTGHMTISELNRVAKETDDQKILIEAVQRGSTRIRGSVLENTNLEKDVLRELYKTAKEGPAGDNEKKTITEKPNYPIEDLKPDELRNVIKKNNWGAKSDKFYEHDSINDEKAIAANSALKNNVNGVSKMVFNKNNQMTNETRKAIVDQSPALIAQAADKGFYKPSIIRKFDDNQFQGQLYANGSKTKNKELLDEFATEIIRRDMNHSWEQITRNENLSAATINKIAISGKMGEQVASLHHHPNTSDDTKLAIESLYPHTASYGKAERATGTRNVLEAQKALTVKSDNSHSTKGWSRRKVQVNKEKVAEYGLSDEDVRILFTYGHNAGGHYNSETGTFVGNTDSSG